MDKQFSEQEAAEKAFNIFCLKVLQNEAINAAKGLPKWQINEVCVLDITHREDILKDYDNYIIANSEIEDRDFYSVGNKIITHSLITWCYTKKVDKNRVIYNNKVNTKRR